MNTPADLIHRALNEASANGTLPAHLRARLDDYAVNGQAPEVAAAWRARAFR